MLFRSPHPTILRTASRIFPTLRHPTPSSLQSSTPPPPSHRSSDSLSPVRPCPHPPPRPLQSRVRVRSSISPCPPGPALLGCCPRLAKPHLSAQRSAPAPAATSCPCRGLRRGALGSAPRGLPPPQLQPLSPPGLGPLLCVSFGHGGAEVTEVAGEGGGREGVLGRDEGEGRREPPSLCGAGGGS